MKVLHYIKEHFLLKTDTTRPPMVMTPQLISACSKSTIGTLEKGVKYVQN